MRTVGVIVEYNPFHNGHRHHLTESVRATGADAVVAVMSGHFLQRGEPALMDKWARAETALRGGCDLVIELPAVYATSAAEWFAYGAVGLLEATGVVDAFCFGSESGDIDTLLRIAALAADEPADLRARIAEGLGAGLSYPTAYSNALRAGLAARGDAGAAAFPLERPNNTLGLHYLIALKRLGSRMEPHTIRRVQAGYHDTDAPAGSIASATALRRLIFERGRPEAIAPYVPPVTLDVLRREWETGRAPVGWPALKEQLFHLLLRLDAAELAGYRDIGEGLEFRIRRSLPALSRLDADGLIGLLKTKRYTRTRLQRALTAVLLGIRKDDWHPGALKEGLAYIRVLGFTPKGRELLRRMRKTAKLPVLLSAAGGEDAGLSGAGARCLELDTRATGVYALAAGAAGPRALLRDYYEPPIIAPDPDPRGAG
jgi:predicted nucleotidyltransferase